MGTRSHRAGPATRRGSGAGTIDVLSYDVETASAEVFYLIWHGEPKTIAFVEILSY